MRFLHITGVAGIAILAALLLSGVSQAEVGAIYEPARAGMASGYVQTVVDEPDPFGYWIRINHADHPRRHVLNVDGDDRGDGPPALAQDLSWSGPVVVWSRNLNQSGYKIVFSKFVAGGWTAPERINLDDGEQFDPAVTVAPNGSLHVVYWQLHNGEYDVRHQVLGIADDAWSLPVVVSQPGDVSCRPSIAIHNGSLKVLYEVHPNGAGTSPKEVTLAERPDEGAPDFSALIVASSSLDGKLWPRIHSVGGKLWVDWIDTTGAADEFDGQMAWSRRTNQGGWTPIEYEAFTSEEQREYHTRGAIRWKATGLFQANPNQPAP